MQLFQSIIIGIATLVSGFFGSAQHYGNIALTTLNGSDRQNVFPTTYNANNTALNNGKIDVGTTSVASITTLASLTTTGTLISGALGTGFTAVSIAQGGTGSTTLSANQVLLGNGTSLMKTVTGWGTSGQLLTSTGAGSSPTWQSASFDTTQNYTFSGNNIFSGTSNFTGTTYLKTTIASSTITISNGGAGVSYSFPTSQGVANSFLSNNGAGTLSWSTSPPKYTLSINGLTANNAFATSSAVAIPANVLNASSTIALLGTAGCNTAPGAGACTYYLRTSTGVTIASCVPTVAANINHNQSIQFSTVNVNAANSQATVYSCYSESSAVATPNVDFGRVTSAIDFSQATSFVLVAFGASGSSATISANIIITP